MFDKNGGVQALIQYPGNIFLFLFIWDHNGNGLLLEA